MIAILHDVEFYIPDEIVDAYMIDFLPLKEWRYRDRLNNLREEILDVLAVVMVDPEALYDPDLLEEFVETLAMRHALEKSGILHDA
jgi:hypothetical protein